MNLEQQDRQEEIFLRALELAPGEARAAWQHSMEPGSAVSALALFMDYMLASEIDKAIVAHDRAMRISSEDPAGIADPRYVAAMTDIGVVEAWDTRGPPDFCSKDTGTWVCK